MAPATPCRWDLDCGAFGGDDAGHSFTVADVTFWFVDNGQQAPVGAFPIDAWSSSRTWLKRTAAPTVTALALFLLASPAHADPLPVKPSLVLPVAPAVPVVAPEPAAPPTVANIAMCTAASLPDAIGKCAGVAPLPPIDTRTFTTVVISGSVALIQLGAGLLTIYLNPQPVGK